MIAANFLSDFESLNIPIPGVRLPTLTIEPKYFKNLGLDEGATNFDFLRALCIKGFKALNLKKTSQEYLDYGNRIKYELDIFSELGFVDYVLLVWDVINFCKENGIPTVLCRGSAEDSLA